MTFQNTHRGRQQRSSSNKRRGMDVEQTFRSRLQLLGVMAVESIPDFWIPGRKVGPREWLCVRGGKKLAGDLMGLLPFAWVVCECKSTPKTLPHGQLKRHQHDRLRLLLSLGHCPVLGWHETSTNRYFVLPYPSDWQPRTSFNLQQAAREELSSTARLSDYAMRCRRKAMEQHQLLRGDDGPEITGEAPASLH